MANDREKLRCCVTYTTQPRNFSTKACNTQCNSNATIRLKPLADQLLQRNRQCNSDATKDKNQRNFTAKKTDEKLHSNPVLKHGISTQELKEFLGEDWKDYKDDPEALALWSDLLFKNQVIEQGKRPDNFMEITRCNSCDYVYVPSELTNGGNVLGCPWCWNRVKGLPIPKPADQLTY